MGCTRVPLATPTGSQCPVAQPQALIARVRSGQRYAVPTLSKLTPLRERAFELLEPQPDLALSGRQHRRRTQGKSRSEPC